LAQALLPSLLLRATPLFALRVLPSPLSQSLSPAAGRRRRATGWLP